MSYHGKSVNREVHVTQNDIDRGMACSGSACPVARALKRVYPNAVRVDINGNYLAFSDMDARKRYYFQCPQSVKKFYHEFDLGDLSDEVLKPFTFRLTILEHEVDLGELQNRKRGVVRKRNTVRVTRSKKGIEGTKVHITTVGPNTPRMPGVRSRRYGLCKIQSNKTILRLRDELEAKLKKLGKKAE